jgi:predicted phage terminase large subunit-like protein
MSDICPHSTLRTLNGGTCVLCDAPAAISEAPQRTRPTLEQMNRRLYRESFADFFRAGWHVLEPTTPLLWSWPYQAVCDHLQALVEDWAHKRDDATFVQRMQNLLVTLPPGCLKSRLLTYLVPWAWLRWPQLRAYAVSCNPRVSYRDNVYARDIVASDWYQHTFRPQWQIRDDIDAKGAFANTRGGWRNAIGFEARIIGERSDLWIVDDPHDPEEVESDAQRNKVHDKWDGTLGNRVNDLSSSIRCGIAQRTHEDDWSARRIAEGWTHLDLPMLYEPDRICTTPLGHPDPRTIADECLHPERFSPDVITKERDRVKERRWATLYQGRPAPATGNMVKLADLRFWRRDADPQVAARVQHAYAGPAIIIPPRFESICIAGDLAGGKETTKGDYNALAVVGRSKARFYLLEFWLKRAGFPEVQNKVRDLAHKYPAAHKVIESAASGAALVASLEAEIPGLRGQVARGDKESRLESVIAIFEAGQLYLPDGAPGLDLVVAMLTMFPNAAHDDMVDAISLALSTLHAAPPARTWMRWRPTVA